MMSKKQLKVLIADDRTEVRKALQLVLSQKSTLSVVGEAADLSAALEAVDRLSPDILLLDWELPTAGEQMTMAELRFRRPEMVVVGMSSHGSAQREALLAGVDAFVSKAEPPESLLAVLAQLESRLSGSRRKVVQGR
ncbi:MAG: response regulator [Anaerolineae bacterium]